MGILDAPGLSKSAVLADRRAAALATNPDKAGPYASDLLSNRTSATTLGTASEKGGAWTALQGTWGTDSNGGYLVTSAGDTRNIAVMSTAGHNRYRVSCDLVLGSGYDVGIVTQVVDTNNYVVIYLSGGRVTVYVRTGGAFNGGQNVAVPALVAGAPIEMRVESSGLIHRVYINAALVLTFSIAASDTINSATAYNAAATQTGIYSHGDTTTRFRNFTVDALPEREWKSVLATFKTTDESLYLLGSNDDGTTWQYLNSGLPVHKPVQAGKGVRDPSIFYNTLDGWWYVAYTRSATGPTLLSSPYPVVGMARTRDLRSGPNGWQHLTNLPAIASVGGSQVWAPEWFIDTDGSIHLLGSVNLGAPGAINELGNWRFHCWHPTDPTDLSKGWGAPVPITGPTWPTMPLDAAIIKVGSTYHLFYADESSSSAFSMPRAQSTSLHSGYTITDTGNWMNWASGVEGPQVIKKAGGGYRCFADVFGGLVYKDSPDLSAGSWGASGFTKFAGEGGNLRHGTVYQVPTTPAGLMAAP